MTLTFQPRPAAFPPLPPQPAPQPVRDDLSVTEDPPTTLRARLRASPRPEVLAVLAVDGELRARTSQGLWPLYRFAPLQAAVLCAQGVPQASAWPEYLKLMVYRYVPLPLPASFPGAGGADLGVRARDPHGLRPYDQLTYRGWPLYLCTLDRPGEAPGAAVPDLFVPVEQALHPLPLSPTPIPHGP